MSPAEPPVILPPWRRRLAVYLKLAGIGGLILLLQIPLLLTHGVLTERQGYQTQATRDIAAVWGGEQTVIGPVLVVPYACRRSVIRPKLVAGKVEQVEETDLVTSRAYFLPDTLSVEGTLEPEVRHRGIYETVVYAARLQMAGSFRPDFAAAGITPDRIDWGRARVLVGVSDLRGVRSMSPFQAGGNATPFESADDAAGGFLPLAARVEGVAAGAALEFSFAAVLQGSERLQIAPVGKTTTVALTSPWPDPSFAGSYLPAKRSVTAGGFRAEWESAHFGHGFPQSWSDARGQTDDLRQRIGAAAFGVTLAQPVDGYRMAERAEKYGLLFFVLTFAVFFLFEMTAGLRIHPLQYGLVGAALCLFFLGFLALTEFLATGPAYGVAAAACTALVALYAWSFLRTGRRTLVIGGGLAATYGYLYFVLQSRDYALLAGTVALFAVLALVMYGTRRIDWYTLETAAPRN